MKKKFLLSTIVILTLLSFSGCGKSDPKPTSTHEEEQETTTTDGPFLQGVKSIEE